ncbi:MAG: oligosaccharide flippase family protein [Rhodobacteraceae bacterium]|jgi:O-antigen/teichoic acid export membrane protein|nr:oligosaccharide flippase family protein [Paracoccaceae bacterium]
MAETSPSGVWTRLTRRFGGDGLKARAIRGSALTFLQFGGENALRLASNLILTRLLLPDAFGLMALVLVVLVGVAMFSDIGTTSAIIQNKRGEDPDFLNTAWTMQVLRGVFLWLIICLLARPMADFYEEPLLAAILPVAGLTALIDGFRSTRAEVLTRRLQVGRLTALALCSQVINIVVLTALAWHMQSVWALVVGSLFGSTLGVVLSHIALPGQPNRFRFEREAFSTLFTYGKYIFLATIAGFLVNQGDRAILGKYVSLAELGIYNIGFFMATVPGLLGNAVSHRILFPLYSRIPPWEAAENRQKISRARFLVTGVLFAVSLALGLAGVALVELLYDPRYHTAGAILVLIVAGSLPSMITQSYAAMLLAAGQSGRFALLVSSRAISNTVLMLWAVPVYGVAGVPIALFASAILTYPVIIALLRPLHACDPRHDAVFAALCAAVIALLALVHPDVFAVFSGV